MRNSASAFDPSHDMIKFSDRHTSRIAETFVEVDALLTEAVHCLDLAALRSPLSRRLGDVTPIQQQLVAHDAERLRVAMCALLARYKIRLPLPTSSALQVARAALDRALVATEALAPSYMYAYGALSDDLEAELNRIVTQVLDLVDSMRESLTPAADGALHTRLEQLAETPCKDALLKELGRLIDAHELTQLRAPLEDLVERLETNDFEITVYGRTNSGKSSLLNFLLDRELLPVGATPVTAFPVRLVFGGQAWGFAEFADAIPEQFALGRLPEFAAEHFNPANSRHLVRLRVEIPATRLKGGVAMVDMPGFDAGIDGGSAAPFASIPRCDLGIVAIDATDILTFEEAAIVDTLLRAGSSALVLLTKADLLRPEDRWRVHGHVSRGLSSKTGVDVPVYFASTVSTDPLLRDDWIERGLEPMLRQREALRQRSLVTKRALLRDRVVSALRHRLSLSPGSVPSREGRREAEALLTEANAVLAAAQRHHLTARAEAERQAGALVDEVAHNAAVLWPQSPDASLDITTLLQSSLQARAAGMASGVSRNLLKLRAQCSLALGEASAALHMTRCDPTNLPRPRGIPLFDEPRDRQGTVLRQPLFPFLGRWRRRAGARRWLRRARVQSDAASIFARHFMRVDEWRSQMLHELRTAFASHTQRLWMRHIESMTAMRGTSTARTRLIADLKGLDRYVDSAFDGKDETAERSADMEGRMA